MNNFCIFILSHNRGNIKTLHTLRFAGCALPIYIIIDDTDPLKDTTLANYSNVIVFDKAKYISETDSFENEKGFNSPLYARNACFDIAKEWGYEYFLQLDDDNVTFYKNVAKYQNSLIFKRSKICKNIDEFILTTLEYYINTTALSISFAQGGDYIFSTETLRTKRKAMNSFFCSTNRPFKFVSKMNDDVSTYMYIGGKGGIFFFIPFIQLDSVQTQEQLGGITELYKDFGTYTKSFYTIICRPDCVTIKKMGTNQRMHHKIDWRLAVPKIISQQHKRLA